MHRCMRGQRRISRPRAARARRFHSPYGGATMSHVHDGAAEAEFGEPAIMRTERVSREELEVLVREQRPRVTRLLLRILGPRQDLDDQVQTVFLELCRALPRFRGESTLATFVGGITVQVARRARTPNAHDRRRTALSGEPPSMQPGPDAAASDAERMRRLRVALGKIKPNKRIAFALWALDGMPPEEIAQVMGASLSATRSRIFHAQRELRALAARDPWLHEIFGETT
jgi:RNA polymerase sigma-70 factor (ECF subfamily)